MKSRCRGGRSDEGGWLTLWVLGLCVMVLFLGGISLDLWRAFSERRALAAAADAGARAGASMLDLELYRETGRLALVPEVAERAACALVMSQTDRHSLVSCAASADADRVEVVIVGSVDLTLTKVLRPSEPIAIRVTAAAAPHH